MTEGKDLALRLTEAIAAYMKIKFYQLLQGDHTEVYFPPEWDLNLLNECDQAITILLEAHGNQRMYIESLGQSISCWTDTTMWKARDYVKELSKRATGRNQRVESKLKKKYPPIFSPTAYHMEPCVVQDEVGEILLWYIPGALTPQRVVSAASICVI
jgi:hypothetical protein